jgi:3',5'-cyclic AMP phosphodiesterase CpdA
MTQSVDFVLLSDLHISHRAPADAGLLTDTDATLAEAVAAIAALDPQPAFVVMAGDLTNHGEPDAYRRLAGLLEDLQAPRVLALGNHDTRAGFRTVMLDEPGDAEAPYCHDQVIAGVHLIVLDSSIPGRIAGALGADQIAFLSEALGREHGLQKVIVCHHPPHVDAGEGGWHSLDAESSARLADAIRGRNVAAILSGHVHFDSVIHWHGVPVVIGMGLHNAVDVTVRTTLRVVDGAGFILCRLRQSGLTASFVPLPRSRRELAIHDLGRLDALDRTGAH